MAYLKYDYQSSHAGYIDIEFKEIVSKPPRDDDWWLSPEELFDAICDGYYVEEDVHIPKHMCEVFDWEGDYRKARVSKRLIKVWCNNVSKNGLDHRAIK